MLKVALESRKLEENKFLSGFPSSIAVRALLKMQTLNTSNDEQTV